MIGQLFFGLLLFATVLGHVANIVTSVSAARKEFQGELINSSSSYVYLFVLARRSYFNFLYKQTEFVRRKQSKTVFFFMYDECRFLLRRVRILIVFYKTLFRSHQYRKKRKGNSRNIHLLARDCK